MISKIVYCATNLENKNCHPVIKKEKNLCSLDNENYTLVVSLIIGGQAQVQIAYGL